MREPNFFIVGGPKCGTTALFNYLKSHPQVFVPWAKEPHFFCDDLPGRREFKRYEDYLQIFAASADEHRAIGEASALYLYSETAVQRILERLPSAKFIVMVRNPLEVVPSLHAQWVFGQYEDETDMVAAWRLQQDRRCGRRVPRLCLEPKMLDYQGIASMGRQLERFLSIAPREQSHIVFYDEFARDTARVYRDVLTFLNLQDDGRTEFPRINQYKEARYPWLQRLICHRRLPESLRLVGRRLGLHRVHHWIWKKNIRRTEKQPIPPGFLEELKFAFRDDVALASDLLHRDLNGWLAT